MLISVITVTNNSGVFLKTAIDSLVAQTYKNYEFILVDNLSSDNTIDIAINSELERKVIISEADSGLYDAMNKGLNVAQGDVVCFLHSDDFLYDDLVFEVVSDLFRKDSSIEVISGGAVLVSRDNKNKIKRLYPSVGFRPWMMRFGFMPPHTATFVKRCVLKKINGFSLEYKSAADFDFFIKAIFFQKAKYLLVDKYFLTMRLGGFSTSGLQSYLRTSGEVLMALKAHNIYSNWLFVTIRLPLKYLINLYKLFFK